MFEYKTTQKYKTKELLSSFKPCSSYILEEARYLLPSLSTLWTNENF